jgi:CHAT domain-containing protein
LTIESDTNNEARSRLAQLQKLVAEENSRSGEQKRDQALQLFSEELLLAQKNYQLVLDRASHERSGGTFDATKVSAALAPRAALLEYVVARDRVAIFVVTRYGLQALIEPVSEQNLRSKVELFRELLTNGDQTDWRKPAASLYSTLILPLEQRGFLRGMRTLIVVPHGVLNYLPFAALPRSAEANSRFLIENYEIQEEPAASFLVAGTERSRSVERVGTFAPASAKLKYAVPEARDVAGIFGSRGEAILGRNATKSKFQKAAPDYDIVHIATHGFFNKNNPILSGLQFEADGTDDGKLEVHDILVMRLTARLITLSACDTALGAGSYDEIPAGDEFVGLNRAFLEAGSDAVIASLWKVDDRSTDLMMRNFYRRIESTGAPRALAQSQRAMIHDGRYANPRYWAPFVFFGRESASGDISAENE